MRRRSQRSELKEYAELGFEQIYLHTSARSIDAFGVHVLPELS